MTKLLIFGLKDPAGGVESAVMEYVRHFDRAVITADFAVFGENFSLEAEIKSLGGRVHYLPVRRQDPAGYKAAVGRLFAENRYDAVWCNFSGLTNIDFLIYAKKSGIKIRIAHAHTSALSWGNALMRFPVEAAHAKNKLSVDKYATDLFACSARSAVFMYGEKNAEKTRIVPNAADLSKFTVGGGEDVRKELGIPENALVIGHVGRMCVPKNQKFLIDIYKAVREKKKDAVLLFVGDGELHDEITAYAAASGAADGIVFTGARTDVYRLYGAMDVFCLPSLAEGFPVTAVEAQACGLPCVVSEQSAGTEVNISGRVDRISLAAPAEKWADALIAGAASGKKDCREQLAENGFEIVSAAEKLQKIIVGESI